MRKKLSWFVDSLAKGLLISIVIIFTGIGVVLFQAWIDMWDFTGPNGKYWWGSFTYLIFCTLLAHVLTKKTKVKERVISIQEKKLLQQV